VQIPRGDAVALTRALVAIDSRNPTLVPGAPGDGLHAHAETSVHTVPMVQLGEVLPDVAAHDPAHAIAAYRQALALLDADSFVSAEDKPRIRKHAEEELAKLQAK